MSGDLVARIAETLADEANEVVFGESNDEAWLRLAAAAADVLRPQVETVEQLDDLPLGSVVIAGGDDLEVYGAGSWTKGIDGWFWWAMDYGDPANQVPLPALLVYTPGEQQ